MTTPSTASPVEPGRLAELRDLFGGEEEIASLYQEFFHELPDRLQALTAALRNGVPDGVERSAHALSGSSGSLGALCVHRAARAIEEQARQGALDHLEDQLAQLRGELERLRSYLEESGLLAQA